MASRRSGRAAAKKAAAALENTPKGFDDVEDEPMPDAGTTDDVSEPDELSAQAEDDSGDDQGAKGDREDSADDEGKEDGEESAREPAQRLKQSVQRKRLGRPPKNKPADWDSMVTVNDDTPRRRGRGGWRGRGGRKGASAPPKAEQVIDAEGTVAEIIDDECVLPEDAEGETKVDKQGRLNGGREYRCRTFTVVGRGDRLYMLSTEPARCVGFRDSYLFFTKHKKLYKIIVDDEEKKDMIEREIIPHSYKGRSIGIVTARSVFREFGARILVGGRRILDDYNVAQARAEGAVEGQIADAEDRFVPGEAYNKNQYVAWHGASAVYHTNAPTVPIPSGKPEYKKRRVNVNDTNWMLEYAREASLFNAGINAIRKLNNTGVYDIHTNTMQYPAIMQPTLARIEQVGPDEDAWSRSGTLPPVSPRLARNFLVMDTYYEGPSAGNASAGAEKTESAEFLSAFCGLDSVPDEIKDLLPPSCRASFDEALRRQRAWKSRWGTEGEKTSRRKPIIDKAIVPYSMH